MTRILLVLMLCIASTTLLFCDSDQEQSSFFASPTENSASIPLSWQQNALEQQYHLGYFIPLKKVGFQVSTHNSYNSSAYNNSILNYIDPNHTLSLTEQFEAGARAVELDVHWAYSKLKLCHTSVGSLGCHAADRNFGDAINELK